LSVLYETCRHDIKLRVKSSSAFMLAILPTLAATAFSSCCRLIELSKQAMNVFRKKSARVFAKPCSFHFLIGFYGIVAWSIPSIIVAAVSKNVGVDKALAAFGFITLIFGLGQIAGPSVAGVLAERTGSFSSSFFMVAAFAGAAILLTGFLKKIRHTE
jgi:MFS family permease